MLATLTCFLLSAPQVAERAAEEKRRQQAGLQKERLLLEKNAKKKAADAEKKVGGRRGVRVMCGYGARCFVRWWWWWWDGVDYELVLGRLCM